MRLVLPYIILPSFCPQRNAGLYCLVQDSRAPCMLRTELAQRGSRSGVYYFAKTSKQCCCSLVIRRTVQPRNLHSPRSFAGPCHLSGAEVMVCCLPDNHAHVSLCKPRC